MTTVVSPPENRTPTGAGTGAGASTASYAPDTQTQTQTQLRDNPNLQSPALVRHSSSSNTHSNSPTDKSGYFGVPHVNIERTNSTKGKHGNKQINTTTANTTNTTNSFSSPSFNNFSLSPNKMSFAKSPVSPTSKFPFKDVPAGVHSIDSSAELARFLQEDQNNGPVVFDVRPYNLFIRGRIKGAINLCVPSTLLKRPAYDLTLIFNSSSIPHAAKTRILNQTSLSSSSSSSSTSPSSPSSSSSTRILVYDSESYTNNITFSLYQTILKFLKYNSETTTNFEVFYLNGGFTQFEKFSHLIETAEIPQQGISPPPSSTHSSMSSTSPISPIHPSDNQDDQKLKDPHDADHTAVAAPFLSGFTLPSSAPAQEKFLSSIKKNTLNLPKLDIASIRKTASHSPPRRISLGPGANSSSSSLSSSYDDEAEDLKGYHYTFRLPQDFAQTSESYPKWLQFLRDGSETSENSERVLKRLNHQFNKIENSEQIRLNAAINNDDLHASKVKSQDCDEACKDDHIPSVCSPSAPCPGCDNIDYKIPKGIEYGYKNRYNNIWPYEHSRVKLVNSPSVRTASNELYPRTHTQACKSPSGGKLDQVDEAEGDDYFNANYISFPQLSDNRYIATQNPLQSTFEDFWKTVWYNKIPLVVCLNNQSLMLMGKYFDDQDFPQAKIQIRLIEEQDHPHYIYRTIKVTKLNYKTNNEHIVHHLEYKDWPDFGTPTTFDSIIQLIEFKRDLIQRHRLTNKVVVHCSAGCGRTGCFITLDMIIDLLNLPKQSTTDRFDAWGNDDLVYKSIQYQRMQRISMVQNLDQYIVCYEILADYIHKRFLHQRDPKNK